MTQKARPRPRFSWLRVRVGVYVLIAAAVLLFRSGDVRRSLFRPIPGVEESGDSLVVAGAETAPRLVARIVEGFRGDYARYAVRLDGGGTTEALEAIGNRRADVAFLLRPPTAAEQAILAGALGDSVLWFPAALGGLLLLCGPEPPVDSLLLGDLGEFVATGRGVPFPRLYAPDPNNGLWDAFAAALRREDMPYPPGPHVVFLADAAAVSAAVERDPGTLGLASSLDYEEDPAALGVRVIRLGRERGDAAVAPGYEAIGTGAYPLHHSLVVASRSRGGILGSMFVTWVVSERGQRWIERSGQLPARLPLREIILSRHPVGASE